MTDSELPNGWQWVKVGDVCRFEYGKSLPKKMRRVGHTPVYGANGVVDHHEIALVRGPVIIVGRKGSAGAVQISETDCWPIDTTYFVSITDDAVDTRWLGLALKSADLRSLQTSTAIPGLNRNDAYAVNIPLPSLDEQHRIIAQLDERLRITERARTASLAQLAAIEAMPQALLREIFPRSPATR